MQKKHPGTVCLCFVTLTSDPVINGFPAGLIVEEHFFVKFASVLE